MSVRIITGVVAELRGRTPAEQLMLVMLADFADDHGRCYPAVATLAERCRIQPRHAIDVLQELKRRGLVEIGQSMGPKGANLYRVILGNPLAPLHPSAPLHPNAGPLHSSAPLHQDAPLHPSAATPALERRLPLHPSAPEPSLNRHEPSERERAMRTAPASPTPSPSNRAPAKEATRSKASRTCPGDFAVTPEMRAWAQVEAPQVDIERETAKLRDHTFKSPITDWPAAWRNWIRKAVDFSASTPHNGHEHPTIEAPPWHETKGGVKAMGAKLGMPFTAADEERPFQRYKERVIRAFRAAAGDAGASKGAPP